MAKAGNKNSKVTSLLQTMFKTQQFVDSLLNEQAGLGLSAYRILAVLNSAVPLSQRHIAKELGQTEANISRQIRAMADQGLVKIAPDRKDKRQRNITRTIKGDRKFSEAEKALSKHERAISIKI